MHDVHSHSQVAIPMSPRVDSNPEPGSQEKLFDRRPHHPFIYFLEGVKERRRPGLPLPPPPPTAPAIFAAFLVPLQTKVAGESLLADLALEALDSDRSVLVLGVPG